MFIVVCFKPRCCISFSRQLDFMLRCPPPSGSVWELGGQFWYTNLSHRVLFEFLQPNHQWLSDKMNDYHLGSFNLASVNRINKFTKYSIGEFDRFIIWRFWCDQLKRLERLDICWSPFSTTEGAPFICMFSLKTLSHTLSWKRYSRRGSYGRVGFII